LFFSIHLNDVEFDVWVQAIVKYQRLLLLVRGKYPQDLLPPAPDGYVISRLRELASEFSLYNAFNMRSLQNVIPN